MQIINRTTKNIALALGVSLLTGTELLAVSIEGLCDNPYVLLQLGNQGTGDGELSVDSRSTVYGNVGKANDGQGKELKVSSSTINGRTDRATGVNLSLSSSTITGGNFADVDFSGIVSDALAVSAAAAAMSGIFDTVNLNGTSKLFTGNGGANVINVNGNFILNSGAELRLTGGVDDFFIFNIAMENEFKITGSDIVLMGALDPSRVLFNILGSVPQAGPDDVIIQQSLFYGTILAPGRHVLINDNEYTEGNGLYGSVIAGGKLLFAESDITHDPFCTPTTSVPESGATLALLVVSLLGLLSFGRHRQA